MKKQYLKKIVVAGVAGLCLGIICFATSSNAAQKKTEPAAMDANDGGTLVISRNPSVGSGIFVNVSADGKQLITLSSGRRYKGTMSPGKHTLSVIGDPNLSGQQANKVEVTVEKGKTYAFSVGRKNGNIVLISSQ
jgi:hypothetical protein